MRIDIVADDSIGRQARTYAEYRLFAALSQVADTTRVRSASLVLRRARSGRDGDAIVGTVIVALDDGGVARLTASGAHPYAAINRAVERLRHAWKHDSACRDMIASD